MQWIVGHRLELRLIVIYIRYQSATDSFQWNVESTSELDSKKASPLIGSIGPCFDLIYHDDTIYESWIGSWFTRMYKGILVIMQGYTRNSE